MAWENLKTDIEEAFSLLIVPEAPTDGWHFEYTDRSDTGGKGWSYAYLYSDTRVRDSPAERERRRKSEKERQQRPEVREARAQQKRAARAAAAVAAGREPGRRGRPKER